MSDRYQDRCHDSGISDEELQRQYREEELAKVERWKAEYDEKRQCAVAMAKGKAKTMDASVVLSKSIIHPYVKFAFWIVLLLASLFVGGVLLFMAIDCLFGYEDVPWEDFTIAILISAPALILSLCCIRPLKRVYKQMLRIHQIRYKEKCYKRINRIHGYYERGSITESEFESLKKEILSKIE